jgi:Tfp pilus assembly protein PilP
MNKNILFVGLLAILMGACTTSQNSVANNNSQAVAPSQSQVPAPVKPTNKYQKNKSSNQLMRAPNALNEKAERAENVRAVRDTI